MRLAAKHRNATCDFHVGTRTIGAAERVAGQRSARRVGPGHDHPAVQATRQRHGHRIAPPDVFREDPSKGLLQVIVEVDVTHCRLSFPRFRTEVPFLSDMSIRSEDHLEPPGSSEMPAKSVLSCSTLPQAKVSATPRRSSRRKLGRTARSDLAAEEK